MVNQPTTNVVATDGLAIRHERDVTHLISLIRRQGALVKMTVLNQTKLITIASELARNMLAYGGGGQTQVESVRRADKAGIRLIFTDSGPGIANIDQAMQDGYSSGTGLGLGLPGSKRLASEFNLTSVVGVGTTVTVIMWTNG